MNRRRRGADDAATLFQGVRTAADSGACRSSMSTEGPILYGKYQLLEQIARGGMAELFKAKAHGVEGFEKILVIKRILPELSENPRFVDMFINEAKIAVTLSHANIVQVFDLRSEERRVGKACSSRG